MKATINLRVEQEPYPHLRDDEGCVLARDFQHEEKLEFILTAVKTAELKDAEVNSNLAKLKAEQ